jgi:hypothetical protein
MAKMYSYDSLKLWFYDALFTKSLLYLLNIYFYDDFVKLSIVLWYAIFFYANPLIK